MKKLCSVCLILALFLSVFAVMPAHAATVVHKGFEVSSSNGDVDWNAVKNAGTVNFAMLQAYNGTEKDDAFEANYANATAAGVPLGASMVLTAKTPTTAKTQVGNLLKALENKPFLYAICIYVGGDTYGSMNKATVTSIASTALATLQAGNYFTVLYMDYTFSKNNIDTDTLKQSYALCIGSGSDNDAWLMRRTSKTGKVAGVKGNVALFNTYHDFPTTIRQKGLNNVITAKGNWNGIAWDQRDNEWAWNYFGAGSVYDTACGILSTCNAINYMTGAFPDHASAKSFILDWANYAHNIGGYNPGPYGSDGGYRYIMFGTDISNPPPLQTKYGATYNFTMPITWTEVWNGANGGNNNIYVNTQTALKNYLANGAVAIAHVPGHFICLADYDPATDKFLVLDSYDYWTRENTYCDGVEWVTAAKLSGGLPALTVGGYCVLQPTVASTPEPEQTNKYPYVSGSQYMLYDGETTFEVAGDETTKTNIYLHYEDTQGDSSLKMDCTSPTSGSNNKGGYASQLLKASSNLSNYKNFGIDIYLPNDLKGIHAFKVGFYSNNREVASVRISMNDWAKGWHNITIPKSEISGNLTAVDALTYTWTNTARVKDATYILVDNVRMNNGSSSVVKSEGEQVKDMIDALPSIVVLADASAIQEVRTYYTSLAETEKAKVTNLSKLEKAEADLAALQGGTYELGDVNGDQRVDAKDALDVLKFAVGKSNLSEAQMVAAEVVGDNAINAKDALEILKYSVGKIAKFPIQG